MQKTSRRQFLKTSFGSSLVISFPSLAGCQTTTHIKKDPQSHSLQTLYLEVSIDNRFQLTFDKVEMGQGVMTGQATLFGEEADIHPERFIMLPAPPDGRYADSGGVQITAGSSSTYKRWERLRVAGAQYRQAVLKAASRHLQVDQSRLQTEDGHVIVSASQRHPYDSFNPFLRNEDFDQPAGLKDPANFRYIGYFNRSLDAREKSLGQASYAIDTNLKGLRSAVVLRSPVHGGQLQGFDEAAIKKLPNLEAVVKIQGGLAIVCQRYYQCAKLRQEIQPSWLQWQIPESLKVSSPSLFASFQSKLSEDASPSIESTDAKSSRKSLSATYQLPYLAHAPMEPQNCTAWLHDGILEIWAGTQSPSLTKNIGVRLSGLDPDKVIVHVAKYMGGGFGRRTLEPTIDAVELALKLPYPIKVIWSREDDMKHSALRPMAVTRMRAQISGDQISDWHYETVSQSLLQDFISSSARYAAPLWLPEWASSSLGHLGAAGMDLFGIMPIASRGAKQPYDLPYDIDTIQVDLAIPTFFWRSVGNSLNGFFVESFVDELAEAQSLDPLTLRQRLLHQAPRALAVVNRVAELANWSEHQASPDKALGMAYHFSYRTHCAQIVEVTKATNNRYRVSKVYSVIDCGQIVNPHIVEAQVRSAIVYGLSAALYGQISFVDGQAQQDNFDSYRILRLQESPELIVETIRSEEHPTGIGEPGLPAVAAALVNAMFRATGKRYRKLPLYPADS